MHLQAEMSMTMGPARKKRKLLPPVVVFRDTYWDPHYSTRAHETAINGLTKQDSKDMYNQTRGTFIDHLEPLRRGVRNERTVIDCPASTFTRRQE
jgi:hypothetical protein